MTYRVGIVGSGFGGTVHAPAFTLHPDFEVVAIASPASAQRIASERNIPHAFTSLDDMLHGVDVDVVSTSIVDGGCVRSTYTASLSCCAT